MEDSSQLELFSQSGADSGLKPQPKARKAWFNIRGYEKAVLLIFLIAAVAIIAFALGVEKGKSPEAYCIQLASFTNKGLAEQEEQMLKRNGFSPFLLSQGKYTVLYVGRYPTKDAARGAVSRLEKRYPGCNIRRQ